MSAIEAAHNVRVLGSGEMTVVLGHGFGTDQSVWKQLVPHLVEEYRVILYDNMGAGTTNPDYYDFDRYSTLEGYAYDLLAILEEFNAGRKCIYVCHSLSAMVGATASIIRSDLFHKLIMLCPTPRTINMDGYYGGVDQAHMDQFMEAATLNYESLIRNQAPLIVGGDLDSEAVQEFTRTLFNMRPDISLSIARLTHSYDMRPQLPQVTVPCHIIQSSKDLFVPVKIGEYIHQRLGGKSIVEVMETEGHLPHLSAPGITIPVLLRHIRHDIVDATTTFVLSL